MFYVLLKPFVGLNSICMWIHKHVINSINSFQITIWFLIFIFSKTVFGLQLILPQQLIKTKNQSRFMRLMCVTCNKNHIQCQNRMKRKVARNVWYGLSAINLCKPFDHKCVRAFAYSMQTTTTTTTTTKI